MDLLIRSMVEEDWEAVAEIFKQGIDMKTATFHTEVPTYEAWDRSHCRDCRLVAVTGDITAGWAALTPYSSRSVYAGVAEVSIYIREGCRGRKVGERLLRALIDKSEKNGYWTLQSGIFEINKASISLHEKLGFRMVGYKEKIGRNTEGEWLNTVLMERRSKSVGV